MAWCRQATSHCLRQCWCSSMSPHLVTKPHDLGQHKLPISTRSLNARIVEILLRGRNRSVNPTLAMPRFTGGNRTMVAAATIVIMAATKKAQQNVFDLYHSYNRTILQGFIWILDFYFKIVLVRLRCYLIPIRCNNGKRKKLSLTMVASFWFSALTMVARVDDDGCIISGG